jgi:hypothetical protein
MPFETDQRAQQSEARRRLGRSPHARGSPNACGASACWRSNQYEILTRSARERVLASDTDQKYRTCHGSLATLRMDRPLWSVHESRVGLTILRPIGSAAFAYVPILNTLPLPHRPRSAI